MLSIIVAMSENYVIGRAGAMPWHLPADLKRFKALTTGHAIIMGRKTWDSIGRPLPERTSIVLTRDPAFAADGAIVVPDLDQALDAAGDDDEPFIIGGGEIYRMALERAERLYLTCVHATLSGDTFFPNFSEQDWSLVSDERHAADEKHAYAFSFRVYERVRQ